MEEEERLTLHTDVEGPSSGPVLVLMHGFGGSARNFRPQMKAFSGSQRVIAFDARGHARSPAPDASAAYEPACFVADLAHVIERATSDREPHVPHMGEDPSRAAAAHLARPGGARVAVCGLSMGAGIALRYGIGHSEDVYALVLASFPRTSADAANREWAMSFADEIERVGLDAAGERFVWGERSRFDAKGAALIRQGFLEHTPHALAHILRKVLAVQPSVSDMQSQLTELDVPTLLVAGENDHASVEASRALAEHLPRAELAVIAGAGHVVNLEAAEQFNSVVRDFLRAHSPHSPGEGA
ncbi:MAG TPA: alpha/beta hydrolase [Polyangiaceae bacterium]